MMEQNQPEQHTDYEANVVARQRNFIARAAAAVSGSIAGIMTGKHLLKKSLRSYLQERLFARDWTGGSVEAIIKNMGSGEVDTISGAITDPGKLKNWAEEYISGKTSHPLGTLVGDEVANKALKDLYGSNPAFLQKAVADYNVKLTELTATRDQKTLALHKEYFSKPEVECKAALDIVKEKLSKATDARAREAAIREFTDKQVLKGNIHKFLETEHTIKNNFIHFTNKAKQLMVDVPVYDEMMKAGTEPGRMGLKLRHAHNKREIVVFSAGAAVAIGAVALKSAKSYLHRNDREKHEASFQAGVLAQREADQTAAVMSHT